MSRCILRRLDHFRVLFSRKSTVLSQLHETFLDRVEGCKDTIELLFIHELEDLVDISFDPSDLEAQTREGSHT